MTNLKRLPQFNRMSFTGAPTASAMPMLPAEFIGCDFTGNDLSGVDFSDCIFDSCSLIRTRILMATRARFHCCDMTEARLSEADLRWTFWSNNQIDRIDLVGCQMTLNCHFFSGMETSCGPDVWKLIYLITGMRHPLMEEARKLIPAAGLRAIEREFERTL